MRAKSQRILLVDDDPHLLLISEKILAKLGYHVIAERNSSHALDLFRDLPEQFHLVITDYKMPGKDGFQLSKEILQICPDMPIILSSGSTSAIDTSLIAASGAKYFIRKPFLKNHFVELVAKAIHGKGGSPCAPPFPSCQLQVSAETVRAARECRSDLSCLEKNTRQLCPVVSCVSDSLHFIKCKDDNYCPYQKDFGGEPYCACPVRIEIYKKYKI